MKRTGHFRYFTITLLALCLILGFGFFQPLSAIAAGGRVLIVSLQTGSADNAGAEFVQLADVSGAPVDISGWKLQYKSATGTSWTTKASLGAGTSIDAVNGLLLATTEYVTNEAHQTMSSGLAATGGHVQLLDAGGNLMDLLGWGSAAAPEGTAAAAPAGGETLARKTDGTGNYIDTGNNAADFAILGDSAPAPAISERAGGAAADGTNPMTAD